MRKCSECPGKVQAVCRHAFGRYWAAKSGNGTGCHHPLDTVAEAWYAAGWVPGPEITKTITLPLDGMPKMPKRPVRPMAQQQSSLPIRPTRAKHERRSPIWY